jgi:hypothetical protein
MAVEAGPVDRAIGRDIGRVKRVENWDCRPSDSSERQIGEPGSPGFPADVSRFVGPLFTCSPILMVGGFPWSGNLPDARSDERLHEEDDFAPRRAGKMWNIH